MANQSYKEYFIFKMFYYNKIKEFTDTIALQVLFTGENLDSGDGFPLRKGNTSPSFI